MSAFMIEVTCPNPYSVDKFLIMADDLSDAFKKLSNHCSKMGVVFENASFLAYPFARESDVVNVFHYKKPNSRVRR